MEGTSLKPGDLVGPYKIVRKIGQGGMGEVYEAFEETLQRRIAVKILNHEASSRPDLVRRFNAEGRALARLQHANIVRVYTLDEHNGQIFMAMEYIDGWALDEYLRTHYFGLHEIMRLARHLLEGLAAAHSAGIVHRDIKPQNIMVDRQLQTKLLDFGIAKLDEDNGGVNTKTGVMLGTLNYIAPEIFNGGSATKQSDIYSLGLVLYLMFTGKSPFTAKTRLEIVEKVASTKVTFGPESNAILPASLKRIIYRMIAKNPYERYQSARDALHDLERVNLNALPEDLRPSLSSHMNIEMPDTLRAKCVQLGLEYFEIRLVVCLAAEITLKGQGFAGQEHIVIGPQALTEAARRYVFAKRQMILKNAYTYSGFRWAAGALVTALAFAVFAVFTLQDKQKNVSPVSLPVQPFPSAPPAALAPRVQVPETKPVAAVPQAKPADAAKPVEATKTAAVKKEPVVLPVKAEPVAPPVKVDPPEVHAPKVEPPVAHAPKVEPALKTASLPTPVPKKPKPAKKHTARAPASIQKAEPPPVQPAPASEPDFLQQKPVLLPTVIERRNR
jgi:tRNA A-37 threonylcarbamoyl transferase component Bud32